ncbi:MAG: hypothetical protein AAGA68_10255 [Pseudomonadota bacterium]
MNPLAPHRWMLGLLLTAGSTVALADVGPSRSSAYDPQTGQARSERTSIATNTPLSVVIPVFDPGLDGDPPKPYHKDEKWDQVFDEIRRTEANLIAADLRDALRDTGLFEKVRVAPSSQAIGELYVIGRIMRSNSEDFHLQVQVMDISQREWLNDIYKIRVEEADVSETARLRRVDPYEALYTQIVDDVVAALARRDEGDLRELRGIADMVFASSYSEETFGRYLGEDRVRVRTGERSTRISVTTLEGLPAAGDEQYARIAAIRTKEELFLDDLQRNYDEFSGRVEPVYEEWQTDAYPLAVDARKERAKSTRRKVFAGLAAAAGVAAGSEADEFRTIALAGSAALAYTAYRSSRQYNALRESLAELGESVDIQLAPTNVEFEGRTQTLEGNAAKQYQDMRNFLREVYAEEATPDRSLVIDEDL